ncbi:MAG: hypothetical protein J3Q66DRAFT_351172, partial [Benniella sp.]
MGVHELWDVLKKKGKDYSPTVEPIPVNNNNGRVLVDLLGCIFTTIRRAFSNNPPDDAYKIVDAELSKLTPKSNSIVYVDGDRPAEKEVARKKRDRTKLEALEKARKSIDRFETRTNNGLSISKQHHIDIKKQLDKSFEWSSESKAGLVNFLTNNDWVVRQCPYEADLEIARECTPGDMVLTRDSDLAVYLNVSSMYRLVSGRKVLRYDLADLCTTMGISRQQLTTLGIVSQNDYSENIKSLGTATNFGIVKELDSSDPKALVKQYLAHPAVCSKTSDPDRFATPERVFLDLAQSPAHLQSDGDPAHTTHPQSHDGPAQATHPPQDDSVAQTPAPPLPQDDEKQPSHASLLALYKALCEKQREIRETKEEERRLQKSSSPIPLIRPRHGSRQVYNRYRTVGKPPESTLKTDKARYSMRTRTQRIEHERPPVFKQYRWKPLRKVPDVPSDTAKDNSSRNMEEDVQHDNNHEMPKLKKPGPEKKKKGKSPDEMEQADL